MNFEESENIIAAKNNQISLNDNASSLPLIELNEEPTQSHSDNQDENDFDDEDFWVITFVDGLDQPIENLIVKIELPNGEEHELETLDHGSIFLPKPEEQIQSGMAKIEVKDLTGEMQKVCELDMQQCSHGAVIRSPKIKVKSTDQPHHKTNPSQQERSKAKKSPEVPIQPKASQAPNAKDGSSTSAKKSSQSEMPKPHQASKNPEPWYLDIKKDFNESLEWLSNLLHSKYEKIQAGSKTPHEVLEGASRSGNPTKVIIGPETGGNENLMLGENERFRDALVRSAKRLKMSPQVLAALISAEAGTKTKKVPVLDKNGKPVLKKNKKPAMKSISLGWNEDAKATGSSAAGLTQFLNGTWLGQCFKKGTFLYDESVKKGWITMIKNDKTKKITIKFVLSSGETTSSPNSFTSDKNVQDCLNMRFNPEWSIMAAADYGLENLSILRRLGFKIDSLTEAEKAKVMYLMHHEGEGNGPLFIRNNLLGMRKSKKYETIEEQITSIFIAQVGTERAKKLIKNSEDKPDQAYRKWLADYIDSKITIGKFFFKNPPKEPDFILNIVERM
jgi:hypothetical protein